MITLVNGFACLRPEDVGLAKRNINPMAPEKGVVHMRVTVGETPPAARTAAATPVDLKI